MVKIQISGQEYSLALNARAGRLLEERTNKSIGEILQGFVDLIDSIPDDGGGVSESVGKLRLKGLSVSDLTAAVWASLNGVRGQKVEYEELEYDLDVETAIEILVAAIDPLLEADEGNPLAGALKKLEALGARSRVAPTGNASGPSDGVGSDSPAVTTSGASSGT